VCSSDLERKRLSKAVLSLPGVNNSQIVPTIVAMLALLAPEAPEKEQ
jgi:hypothetical protein